MAYNVEHEAGAYLLSDTGHEWISRRDLAERLAMLAEQRVAATCTA